jgi:hypothetical protein
VNPDVQPIRTRFRLWQAFAWVLAAFILLTAWQPPILRLWSPADILVLALLLAAEWLVLKRMYREASSVDDRARKVKMIWSALLAAAILLLAISKSR